MMVAVFAALLLALLLDRVGRPAPALAALAAGPRRSRSGCSCSRSTAPTTASACPGCNRGATVPPWRWAEPCTATLAAALRHAERRLPAADAGRHRRHPDHGDGAAIRLRRNPVPAVPAAARGDVRRVLRHHPPFPRRRIGPQLRHRAGLRAAAAGDRGAADAARHRAAAGPRLYRQRGAGAAHAGLVRPDRHGAAARLRGEDGAAGRRCAAARGTRPGAAARWLGGYVLALCAINLVSVVVQCGFGQCHTMGYRLLDSSRRLVSAPGARPSRWCARPCADHASGRGAPPRC